MKNMNGYISSKEIESITKNLLAEKPEETRQFQHFIFSNIRR